MIRNLKTTVEHYIQDEAFIKVIESGTSYTVVKEGNGGSFESRFSVWGSGDPRYQSGQERGDLLDIVCGVLDQMGIGYRLSKSVNNDYLIERVG